MESISYSIDVRHEGLNTYRRISGRDRYVVEQRAVAQRAVWDAQWDKIEYRQSTLRSKEDKKEGAARGTQEAAQAIASINATLVHTLEQNSAVEWESLKNKSRFSQPRPPKPAVREYPTEPDASALKYRVYLNFFDRMFAARRQRKLDDARLGFDGDLAAWRQTLISIGKEKKATDAHYLDQLSTWDAQKIAFQAAQATTNAAIDSLRASYLEKLPEAVMDYCEMVLANSEYPESFPKSWRLDYNSETKLLLIEYSLPAIAALPRLKEIKYYSSRDELTEIYLKDSVIEKMYEALLYQIILRSIHELFAADVVDVIDSIVFNGWVKSVEKATGQEANGCIVSIQASKQQFLAINLAQVDPKACFKKLRGVGSSKLTALIPIRPILELDTQDARFVPSHDVIASLDESINLAAMDWEEFEYLIREVFEKEFNTNGAEVKITRASRDGGVDAVVFDPDPLRGGKIVIQAKRYTNTVGVSAVRDLYGTVMNEGANKGILVTTADYGPDAYEFAKDKPLTLMSGSNLLYLLQKHGHWARIDLKEAKQILLEAAAAGR